MHAEHWGIPDAAKLTWELPEEVLVKAWRCDAGSHHLVEVSAATAPPERPGLAP
jgi:hypothetical protein